MADLVIPKNKTIDNIQYWCVNNPRLSMVIGVVIVFVGILIEDIFNVSSPNTTLLDRIHFSSIIYHLFIILGEAIIVMFFLHMFIEKANNQAHAEHTKQLLGEMMVLSQNALSKDLFADILKDQIPVEVVDAVLKSNFFKTNIIRKNQTITYTFKQAEGEVITVEQKMSFDMEYISGTDATTDYFMPFSLSDTPLAKYVFVQAGYRKVHLDKGRGAFHSLNEQEHFDKKDSGKYREKDRFKLKKAISLNKNEPINVQQILNATYNIGPQGLVDNYFVLSHSIGVTIAFDFPPEYEVAVYPTFPEENLPEPTKFGNKTSYEDIPLLVPGQGYIFSIKKH